MRFRHARSFFRSFKGLHTSDPVRHDLATAHDPPRVAQPHNDMPQMAEEELVYESMRSGRSYH